MKKHNFFITYVTFLSLPSQISAFLLTFIFP